MRMTFKRFVYIICADDGGFVKIGMSDDPKNRLAQFRFHSGRDLYVYFTLGCDNAHAVENKAHKILQDFRKVGEWFDTSPEAARAAVIQAASALSYRRPEVHFGPVGATVDLILQMFPPTYSGPWMPQVHSVDVSDAVSFPGLGP